MKQETEREIKKQKWKEYIIRHTPYADKNVTDLAAYLMTYRFQSLDPDVKTHQKTAQKWVRRIKQNTHFSHAGVQTTEILLEWYAERNPALRETIK